MNKSPQKEALRQILLERRGEIPEKTYLNKSARICSQLCELPEFNRAGIVHCYISMNDRREVNTHLLVKDILQLGKKAVVPITQMKTGLLAHVQLEHVDELKKNEWGVLEPPDGKEIPINELDLVIVPMVGGDRNKNRIGYGKGFYDRFLAQIHCPAVGLLFEQCIVDQIPVESFDVPLSMIITENEIIQ